MYFFMVLDKLSDIIKIVLSYIITMYVLYTIIWVVKGLLSIHFIFAFASP